MAHSTAVGNCVGDEQNALEVGCLSLQVIGARNIKLPGSGGYMDMLLSSQQPDPYCKITLGGCANTSGIGTQTSSGYVWNREQMFFPVKVPLSCILGAAGQRHNHSARADDAGNAKAGVVKGTAGKGGGASSGNITSADAVICGSTKTRNALAAESSRADEVWSRLTLTAQVFHTDKRAAAAAAGADAGMRRRETAAEKAAAVAAAAPNPPVKGKGNSKAVDTPASHGESDAQDDFSDRDQLLGQCTLNLVNVVSGRVPHMEEWVPLSSGGDLKLSLSYDTAGMVPSPGDSVVLLCLSRRLDFFPLPVWDTDDDPYRPQSPSWLWAMGTGRRRVRGRRGRGIGEGFRVEEAGDHFFLVSYPSPEGWRCAVEVHRFLVHLDPTVPRPWSLASARDHAVATPAASAIRHALLRARQEESVVDSVKTIAADLLEGTQWTAGRWWNGGLDRMRKDILFVTGLMDYSTLEATGDQQPQGQPRESFRESDSGGRPIATADISSTDNEASSDAASVQNSDDSSVDPWGLLVALDGKRSQAVVAVEKQATSSAISPNASSPQHVCPITQCPMVDPAVAADGYTYERSAIERWLSENDTSPVTGQKLETKVVFKNWSLVGSQGKTP